MTFDATISVLPEVTGAVMLRLRNDARLNSNGIVTNPAPRVWTIAPQLSLDWDMPTWAVVLNAMGGPVIPEWEQVAVHNQRFDIWCYGPGDNLAVRRMNANRLWRTVHAILCPPNLSNVQRSFILGGCRVMDITPESEFRIGPEPETNWGRIDCSYLVRYSEMPFP